MWDENQFVNELQVARSVWTRGSGEREKRKDWTGRRDPQHTKPLYHAEGLGFLEVVTGNNGKISNGRVA